MYDDLTCCYCIAVIQLLSLSVTKETELVIVQLLGHNKCNFWYMSQLWLIHVFKAVL